MDFIRRLFTGESQKNQVKKENQQYEILLPDRKNLMNYEIIENSKWLQSELFMNHEILYDERKSIDIIPLGNQRQLFTDRVTSYDWLQSDSPLLMNFLKSKSYPIEIEKMSLNSTFRDVLPLICRMWVCNKHDNSLYIWNYITGCDVQKIPHTLHTLNEPVRNIHVIQVDKLNNVTFTHVLFLFNSQEICAIGVDFSNSRDYSSFSYYYDIDLNIMKLNNNCLLSKISNLMKYDIKCIETTCDGRIFIVDQSGTFYELCYKIKDGQFLSRYFQLEDKFSEKILKKNMFNTWFRNEKLNKDDYYPLQLVYDNDRAFLYLLCTQNIVKVYKISSDSSKITEHVIFDASLLKSLISKKYI